ncbi:MAG: protein-L-isoaspartate(D-aspartate) O-methyltransferase [Planctomycetota bacterium]
MRALPVLAIVLLAGWTAGCPRNGDGEEATGPEIVDWRELREAMVSRIREDDVASERVLDAMMEVERHRFVGREYRRRSYQLNPLPIGEEQTISSPWIVAVMTEMLELEGEEKILEIGTGSGYQAAILARLVPKVFSMEIRPALAETAKARLQRLGFANVDVRCGDGYAGWPEEAPFDAIIVTAAPPEVPQALVSQLAVGGVLVVPVGRRDGPQQLIRLRKGEDGTIRREEGTHVLFVPMIQSD